MMKASFIRAGVLVAALWAAAGVRAENFPVGSHVFVFTVKNEFGAVAQAEDGYSLRLYDESGTVQFDAAAVTDVDEMGVNCVMSVPMTLAGSAITVKAGDKVTIRMFQEVKGVVEDQGCVVQTVGKANDITWCVLQIAKMRTFDAPDGGMVGVPEEYIQYYQPWLNVYCSGKFDPFGDPDGDGRSNYEEYLSGTDPFSPDEGLKIVSFVREGDELLLGFNYQPGVIYTLFGADVLGAGAVWRETPFRTVPDGALTTAVFYPFDENDETGLAVIRVPVSEEMAKYYRIQVK